MLAFECPTAFRRCEPRNCSVKFLPAAAGGASGATEEQPHGPAAFLCEAASGGRCNVWHPAVVMGRGVEYLKDRLRESDMYAVPYALFQAARDGTCMGVAPLGLAVLARAVEPCTDEQVAADGDYVVFEVLALRPESRVLQVVPRQQPTRRTVSVRLPERQVRRRIRFWASLVEGFVAGAVVCHCGRGSCQRGSLAGGLTVRTFRMAWLSLLSSLALVKCCRGRMLHRGGPNGSHARLPKPAGRGMPGLPPIHRPRCRGRSRRKAP